MTITVTDTLTLQSDSKTFAVNVSDPPVNATGVLTIEVNTGVNTGPQPVAKFTDPGGAEPNISDPAPPNSSAHYSASVNWGDSLTSAGVITPAVPSTPAQQFTDRKPGQRL